MTRRQYYYVVFSKYISRSSAKKLFLEITWISKKTAPYIHETATTTRNRNLHKTTHNKIRYPIYVDCKYPTILTYLTTNDVKQHQKLHKIKQNYISNEIHIVTFRYHTVSQQKLVINSAVIKSWLSTSI